MTQKQLCETIKKGELDSTLSSLYPDLEKAKSRCCGIVEKHFERFGEKDKLFLFSSPGRTEISGNHTDHQHGRVLAGSVNLDVIAAVSLNDRNEICVHSIGHDEAVCSLDDLTIHKAECGHSPALIRGIAAKISSMGLKIGGFDAFTTSDVLTGSGLSSSAAFEILVAKIINELFNNGALSAVELAKISQYAEREYFGKPSGLMDQTACSVGGMVEIDFKDNANPIINEIPFDLASCGYKLIITNTGANHSDLIDDYASVPRDMLAVAKFMGKPMLREVDKAEFYKKIPDIRQKLGDKAVLRAIHFFNENDRVPLAANALKNNALESFFAIIKASGKSSFQYLQNVYSDSNPKEQSISLALALSDNILGEQGAYRVHGGGFAGTVQAFVPNELVEKYCETLEAVFGANACYILDIRQTGAAQII